MYSSENTSSFFFSRASRYTEWRFKGNTVPLKRYVWEQRKAFLSRRRPWHGRSHCELKSSEISDTTTVRACASFVKLRSQYEQTARMWATSKRAILYFCALSPSHKMALTVVSYFWSKKICEEVVNENYVCPRLYVGKICSNYWGLRAEYRWRYCSRLALEKRTKIMLLCRKHVRISFWINNYVAKYNFMCYLVWVWNLVPRITVRKRPCWRTGLRREDLDMGRPTGEWLMYVFNH